jgi:hypothetical protein
MKRTLTTILVLVVANAAGLADPLADEVLKFSQQPMIATAINGVTYFGHDEESTAYWGMEGEVIYNGTFMADDFADKVTSDIVHISWWGSYIQQGLESVDKFLIVFENDVPAGQGERPFSYPDNIGYQAQVIHRGVLLPGSGTFTEALVPGSSPLEPVYKYNAELKNPFTELADTVYWLKIVALVDVLPGDLNPTKWGWHNRDYTIQDPLASTPPAVIPGEHIAGVLPDGTNVWHFQDDAVTGPITNIDINTIPVHEDQDPATYSPCNYLDDVDGPYGEIGTYSKDLAFELYYIPEPITLSLLAFGAAVLLRRRK